MATKRCTRCGEEKELDLFPRVAARADGRASHCKTCAVERMRAWRNSRPEQAKLHAVTRDQEKKRAAHARWRAGNVERERSRSNRWKRENPSEAAALAATRRAITRRAAPAWANRFYIAEAYRLARIRTAATGIKHVVDHIVPLQSPLVCGLHVEANLQVIPESINASKGNRWWNDMPEELWLHP